MLCKNCNEIICDNDIFCGYCGYKLANNEEFNHSDELNEVKDQPEELCDTQPIEMLKENKKSGGKTALKIIFLVLLIVSIMCNIFSSVLLWAKKENNTDEHSVSLLSELENYYNLFSDDGLCLVKAKYGKYGYIDKNGSTIIEPSFDYAKSFVDGKAIVKINDKYGIINTKGEYIVEPQYDYIESYSCGLACVSKNEHYGYIDESGELVIPLEYLRAGSMYEDGYAIVLTKNKKYALLTINGVLINLNLGDMQIIGEYNYLEEICEFEGCYKSANGNYCEEHDKTLTDDNCIWPDCEEERKYGDYCFKHYCGMDD